MRRRKRALGRPYRRSRSSDARGPPRLDRSYRSTVLDRLPRRLLLVYVVDPRELHEQVPCHRAAACLLLQPIRQRVEGHDLANGGARLADHAPDRLLRVAMALHQPADRSCFFERVQILPLDVLDEPELLGVAVAEQGRDRDPP
jgi:hypothetical protein